MSKEHKTTCAPKCYKLDRPRCLCERYNQPVKHEGLGNYRKCQECIDSKKENGDAGKIY